MDANSDCPFSPIDLCLSGNDVHIWCACLDQPGSYVEKMVKTLSTEELKRAERFYFLQHRNQFVVAHGMLRKLLADYTKIESDRINFEYGRNGKPFLSEEFSRGKIRFNLSHSTGYALFAFSCERDVGVDVERICELTDMDKVAEQFFSSQEIAALRSFPESQKKEAFFKFWTRKEAYLKATGEGFSSALDTINISSYNIDESIFVNTEGNAEGKNHWTVRNFKPLPGFAAAFAVEGDGAAHHYWQIPNSIIQSFDKNG